VDKAEKATGSGDSLHEVHFAPAKKGVESSRCHGILRGFSHGMGMTAGRVFRVDIKMWSGQ